MILIVDFGSQTAHLIGRRLKDFGVPTEIVEPEFALDVCKKNHPKGIIFSGGPASVYEDGAPTIDSAIYDMGVPMLAICYGQQLTAYLLGGKVEKGTVKEFGPATLKINLTTPLFNTVPKQSRIWMSHGDKVVAPPPGFRLVAETENILAAAMVDEKRNIYCIQFHPEVEHTEHGTLILKNFLTICQISTHEVTLDANILIEETKTRIGSGKAIAAVSGGLDSTVASTIVAKAIGNRLIPVHIDSGLMRAGTTERVKQYYNDLLGIPVIVIDAKKRFLDALSNLSDPEKKRKTIGKLYIDLFEEVLTSYSGVTHLVQGTIYSDVIESKGTKHADTIKSHHNVGGLPETMKLTLCEPLRELYTDQVRELASQLDIPEDFISEQPHPGPGYAIRILGEVTEERLEMITKADNIVIEEMKASGWYRKLLHSFAIATGTKSTAVKGDGRVYGEVIAIRTIISKDRMTADWAHLPYEILQKVSSRIVNEVPGVSRVVYDITTKPPATMEWE